MHKKFEINRTKNKGSCQSGRKVVTHNSESDLPLSKKETLAYLVDLDRLISYILPKSDDPPENNSRPSLSHGLFFSEPASKLKSSKSILNWQIESSLMLMPKMHMVGVIVGWG